VAPRARVFVQADPRAHRAILGVDDLAAPVQPLELGARAKCVGHGRKCARQEHVVAVEPTDDVARGTPQPLVDGIDLASVPLADVGEPIAVALQDRQGCVGAATVDHVVVELEVPALREHALDRARDELALIV